VSIVFNEAAFHNLLEAPDGPFGDKLRLVAETITANYNDAIGIVWQNQPRENEPDADYEIGFGQYGLQAEIGILKADRSRSDGKANISEYMDKKFASGADSWILPLIMFDWNAEL
jgi:hypothetical protein